jgi:hypothetical protein
MKVYFFDNHIEIHTPIYIGNMKPLFDIHTYYDYLDIPKDILSGLTTDQEEMIWYHFVDMKNI